VQTRAEHGVVAAFCRTHPDALKAASGALGFGLVADDRSSFVDPGRRRIRERTPQPINQSLTFQRLEGQGLIRVRWAAQSTLTWGATHPNN
jgi:hypothetical protein